MKAALWPIGRALDQTSCEWLSDNHPALADAVELAVQEGAQPGEIRRFVMHMMDCRELALRCEQAARHLTDE